MSKKPTRILGEYEYVVVAWAEPAAGPGWANAPVWYVVYNRATGEYDKRCLQPEEQGPEVQMLYRYSALISGDMRVAVNKLLGDAD